MNSYILEKSDCGKAFLRLADNAKIIIYTEHLLDDHFHLVFRVVKNKEMWVIDIDFPAN